VCGGIALAVTEFAAVGGNMVEGERNVMGYIGVGVFIDRYRRCGVLIVNTFL